MRWLPARFRQRQRVELPHFLLHQTFHHELRDGVLVPVLDPPVCSCGTPDCEKTEAAG